jgi:hypothetical protein
MIVQLYSNSNESKHAAAMVIDALHLPPPLFLASCVFRVVNRDRSINEWCCNREREHNTTYETIIRSTPNLERVTAAGLVL